MDSDYSEWIDRKYNTLKNNYNRGGSLGMNIFALRGGYPVMRPVITKKYSIATIIKTKY